MKIIPCCILLLMELCLVQGPQAGSLSLFDPLAFSETDPHGHKREALLTFEKRFHKLYPRYEIDSYCMGNYTEEALEYAVSMQNKKTKTWQYIVLPADLDKKAIPIHTFSFAKMNIKNMSFPGFNPRLSCYSAMQIRRKSKILQTFDRTKPDRTGSLNPMNDLDTLCLTDEKTDFTAQVCYSYDSEKKQFVSIGGWQNNDIEIEEESTNE